MESGFNAHVTRAEWRWVLLLSLGLLLLAYLPFAVLLIYNNSTWQFMGFLHNAQDGATYLSKMMLGVHGNWLVHFQHTPEPHESAFLQVLYPLLGRVAGLLGMPVLIAFHLARALAARVYVYGPLPAGSGDLDADSQPPDFPGAGRARFRLRLAVHHPERRQDQFAGPADAGSLSRFTAPWSTSIFL